MSDLQKKICAVMADVGALSKDRENAHFRYNYVSAEAVRAKVQKACVKHGLVLRLTFDREDVTPTVSVMKSSCFVSDDGLTFVHLGDGWGAGTDKGDKSPMKACTAAAKYALANAFCIALGDDPEADEETDKDTYKRDDRLGDEEHERAAKQGAATRAICDGYIGMLTSCTHVDEVMSMLNEHIDVIDSMGPLEVKRFGQAAVAHVETGLVEGMTALGFREAYKDITNKSRKARKGK
jgi:hypothetical protein